MDSFIAWIGGKKLLRNEIIARFPTNIEKYIEVFGGAAWILFAREKHAKIEVYNDIDENLVNLYRCVKFHCQELQRELEFVLNSREIFENYKAQYVMRGLTDIQRAARCFAVIKISYGAGRRTYGTIKKDIIKATEVARKILCKVQMPE